MHRIIELASWFVQQGFKAHQNRVNPLEKSQARFFPVTFLGVLSDPFRG